MIKVSGPWLILEIEVVRVRSNANIFVQGANTLHLIIGQFEVEDGLVLDNRFCLVDFGMDDGAE